MTQQVIARSGYWSSLGRSLNQRADARDSSAFICKSLRLICDSNTLRVNSPLATIGALSNPRSFVTADAMDDEEGIENQVPGTGMMGDGCVPGEAGTMAAGAHAGFGYAGVPAGQGLAEMRY